MTPGAGRALRRLVPALIVLGLVVGLLVAVPLIRSLFRPAPGPDQPSPPRPTERPLPVPEGAGPFRPRTYREGGSVVMPVTFPDGTTAEVLFPDKLGPTAAGSYAYVKGAPKQCHPGIRVSWENLARSWIRRAPPIAVYEGVAGRRVGLWEAKRSNDPWHILAWDFGPWVAMVPCEVDPAKQSGTLMRWAANLDAQTAKGGFLVLVPRAPLRLVASGLQDGPQIRFEVQEGAESEHPLIELTLARCSPSPIELVPGGTAHGCFQGGVNLYALGPREFLNELRTGLEVRNVNEPGR